MRYFILLFLLLCIGCGKSQSNVATIAGEVKLDGQPLEQGSIRFLPMQGVEGSLASGEIVKGRYQITGKAGPAIGWNRVEINGSRKTGRMIPKPFPEQDMIDERVEAVPPQFNTDSTLQFDVKPGENSADFEVTSKY
jgi:hypothetical protein